MTAKQKFVLAPRILRLRESLPRSKAGKSREYTRKVISIFLFKTEEIYGVTSLKKFQGIRVSLTGKTQFLLFPLKMLGSNQAILPSDESIHKGE